ncbi:MAG TPA: 2-succinyl-5-enolpyruvyl-6-hydroxy-3-cyclohexene-1-carboxylic-acid synthase [Cyclobacteriaceae bacterium]|nr:2-succinyl-5-enolpyruvyl-6-hydroxy-3-cyclohexene-1-carboxylic-acid synthase [Cyclobacteriaceae bacterium]
MRLQPIFDIAGICSRKGIKDAIVCPGSRCAPLTLAFARHPDIQTRTISDERSAGFIALGIAQQTKRTVVLICTSGTAAYNFAPAVAEAYYQRIPLLVLTADRPTEWIGQWDGQTISQQNIYGNHVKRSYHLPQEYDHPDSKWWIQRSINEAVNLTQEGFHGPVHVNVPLREPLYPPAGEAITYSDDIRITERLTTRVALPPKSLQQLSVQLDQSKRVLVVGGQGPLSVNLVAALNSLATLGDVVVVGDVISNLHALPSVIRYADIFLTPMDGKATDLQPDLLITIGQSVISKNLKLFLRANKPAAHWHVDESAGQIVDPFQSITTLIPQNPEDLFATLAKSAKGNPERKQYVERWSTVDQKTSEAVKEFFGNETSGELSFVDQVMHELPDHTSLHVANSMAVRYANFCGLGDNKKGVQVYSNRGTSGIDGCTSTAMGHALSSDTIHTLITGDVAFFYDRNAFWNNYDAPNLRVIVLNNHGGAIFGMIDGPTSQPEVDEYFVTRQPLTAKHLADEFGLTYHRVTNNDNAAVVLEDFFKPGSRSKILEFESGSKEAKELFLRFKENVKRKIDQV